MNMILIIFLELYWLKFYLRWPSKFVMHIVFRVGFRLCNMNEENYVSILFVPSQLQGFQGPYKNLRFVRRNIFGTLYSKDAGITKDFHVHISLERFQNWRLHNLDEEHPWHTMEKMSSVKIRYSEGSQQSQTVTCWHFLIQIQTLHCHQPQPRTNGIIVQVLPLYNRCP